MHEKCQQKHVSQLDSLLSINIERLTRVAVLWLQPASGEDPGKILVRDLASPQAAVPATAGALRCIRNGRTFDIYHSNHIQCQ